MKCLSATVPHFGEYRYDDYYNQPPYYPNHQFNYNYYHQQPAAFDNYHYNNYYVIFFITLRKNNSVFRNLKHPLKIIENSLRQDTHLTMALRIPIPATLKSNTKSEMATKYRVNIR